MPTRARGRGRRGSASRLVRRALLAMLVCALVLVGVGVSFYRGVGPLPDPEGCSAHVGGVDVALSTEQGENASVIAAVAVRRGMPARAVSIALAAAFQESKLQNLDHGDRDSLGLFQQRPSQGWGTAAQIRDPYYAANRFYDELAKIHGYQNMRINDAAQLVQRSGYPQAYAAHEADARALASALTGYSRHAFSCVVHAPGPGGSAGASVDAVRRDLRKAFGPGQVAAHGHSLRVPVGSGSAARARGWAVASYLVAQADRLGLRRVSFDGRVWSAGDASGKGWRHADGPGRDHVRATVY
ncbi:MAG TPA: hypothetical protein VFJ19_01965 [Nocardioidaceae bacterium]|nr:hypothetical protein [Nocardioidaceae bacterium]